MKGSRGTSVLLALAIAGCGGSAGNNSANSTNVVAEEGLQDLNSAISGDELSPIPEAEDDMIANRAVVSDGAANAVQPLPPVAKEPQRR